MEFSRVDVHEVIARALDVCAPQIIEAGLNVVRDLSAEQHDAQADPSRLLQLFWNLIRNASRFVPRGTRDPDDSLIQRRPRLLPIRGVIDGRWCEPSTSTNPETGRLLVVEVHDTGIGIDPEFLERIFDPFGASGRSGGSSVGAAWALAWRSAAPGPRLTGAD